MAYVDEVIPVPSVSGQARVEGMRERIKGFLRPVAIRSCGGHTLDRQPFVDFRRGNIGIAQGHVTQIAGLFHVTTEEAFPSILNDGLKAGIDLTTNGRGRIDIHMLIAPPYPNDVVGNGRIKKMWNKRYQAVVILSIKMEALDLTNARINHQGLVLENLRPPKHD